MKVDYIKSGSRKVKVNQWLTEPPDMQAKQLIKRCARLDDISQMAIMPDVHAATDCVVGSVIATTTTIYPGLIGQDIGCGMLSVKLDGLEADRFIAENGTRLLDALALQVPIMAHDANHAEAIKQQYPELLTVSHETLSNQLCREAFRSLGTIGRGNHFVEFQTDQQNQLWLLIHSGSRTFGRLVHEFHKHRARQDNNQKWALPVESNTACD